MGNHLIRDKQIISGKKYLSHNIAVIPPVVHSLFNTQVIEGNEPLVHLYREKTH